MISKQAKQLIEKTPLYIATANNRGNPHIIAVACVKVVDGNILITDNYMKTTKRNLISNGKIEILVYTKSWKGYRIKGKAKYYNSGKWLEYVKSMKENKKHPAKGAIIIKVNKIVKVN